MFESVTAHAQKQILDSLYTSAATLAENSGGLMVAYEPDLKRFEHISLSVNSAHYRIDGSPITDPDQVDFIAGSVDKRYKLLPEVLEAFNASTKDADDDDSLGVVDLEGEILKSGQNTVDAYEHIELLDVALGGVAKSNRHRRRGIEHRSVLIASKAVQLLGINLEKLEGIPPEVARGFLHGIGVGVEDDGTVPVPSFLKIAFDATYLTFPSTRTHENMRKRHMQAVKAFNGLAIGALIKDMDRSNEGARVPIQLSVAAPGTTVKLLDTSGLTEAQADKLSIGSSDEAYVIGSINPAIGKFTRHGLTFAHALRLNEQPPAFLMDKSPFCVRTAGDVRRLGRRMVVLASALEPGRRFVQDWNDELPIVRPQNN